MSLKCIIWARAALGPALKPQEEGVWLQQTEGAALGRRLGLYLLWLGPPLFLELLPAWSERYPDLNHPAPEPGSDPLENRQLFLTNSRCFSRNKWNSKCQFQRSKEDSTMQASPALCQKVSVYSCTLGQ